MRRYILFALLLMGGYAAFAQTKKIDSLRNVVQTEKDDTNKVIALNLLTRQIYLRGNYDTAMLYAGKAITLSEKLGYKKGLANAHNNIGNVRMSQGDYPAALKSHSTSLEIQTEIDYPLGIATSHNGLGNIYFSQGIYPEALKHYLAAMKLYKVLPNAKTNLASSYNNIGNVYFSQGNFDDALKNYEAARKTREEIGDKVGLANAWNNIGNVYFSRQDYDGALKAYSTSLELRKEVNDRQGVAGSYSNIGNVYLQQQNYPEALNTYFEAEKICIEIGDKTVLGNAYVNIGTANLRQGKNPQALSYFNKSLAIGKVIQSKDLLKNSYLGLAVADSAMGNWNAAFENHKLYVLYLDSLQSEENTQKITQAQMNFDFEQKEALAKAEQDKKDALTKAESDRKDAELHKQRLINIFVAASLILLLLSSFLVFNRYRLKQRNRHQQELNKQQKAQAAAVMETQEQERKRIAEDLHDSLGHMLSTVKLNLQTLPANGEPLVQNALELLNQASAETRNITFNLMPRTLEEAGLVPALNELAAKINATNKLRVFLQVHGMENVQLEKQVQFNIYRIIQEAVNNILKHAQAGEVNIQLLRQGEQLTIMIEDDGKGFDPQTMKPNSRGLGNIRTRSAWLNGTIAIDSTPGRGTTVAIEIPVLN